MSTSETPAVVFDNVSKTFVRHGGPRLLRDRISHLLRPRRVEPFHALDNISFRVSRGEGLAVMGHNGAGKTTLLSLLTGLARPDSGDIRVTGRVATLIELGAGFHPDLSGEENVRINAALMGLGRKDVERLFPEIVDFAGIGDFINEPLRTYSLGMIMRLAFATAVTVEPDVLVIDEVLGVGDEAFFYKCVSKIAELRSHGTTLICVSHALETVATLCDRGLWLDHGRIAGYGEVHQVIAQYRAAAAGAARELVHG